MLDVFDPYSLNELASCLERAEREVGQVFAALPAESFVARPAPDAWSPGEHLAYLVLSTRAVEQALAISRLLLWLRFGPSGRTSRRYVEVREWDEAALDRIRLPHPLLGKLAVRETLLFTLYHDRHHLDAVRCRTEEALPANSRGGVRSSSAGLRGSNGGRRRAAGKVVVVPARLVLWGAVA